MIGTIVIPKLAQNPAVWRAAYKRPVWRAAYKRPAWREIAYHPYLRGRIPTHCSALRDKIIAELRATRFPIDSSGETLQYQKQQERPDRMIPLCPTGPNTVDFESYRLRMRTQPFLYCTVYGADFGPEENIAFCALPSIDEVVAFENNDCRYVVSSITHLPTRPGSLFRPVIEIEVDLLRNW
jgi:hypothetical protein